MALVVLNVRPLHWAIYIVNAELIFKFRGHQRSARANPVAPKDFMSSPQTRSKNCQGLEVWAHYTKMKDSSAQ